MADEVTIAFSTDSITISAEDICVGSPLAVEITGLDSGGRYALEYEIFGANNHPDRRQGFTSLDTSHSFLIVSVTFDNPGLDTLHLITINEDTVPEGKDILTYEVLAYPTITEGEQPFGKEVCIEEDFSISAGIDTVGYTYQWYSSDSKDGIFLPISNGSIYQGVTTNTLEFWDGDQNNVNVDSTWYTLQISNGICPIYSDTIQVVKDTTPPKPINCPNDTTFYLEGDNCSINYNISQYALSTNFYDSCSEYDNNLTAHRYYNGKTEKGSFNDPLKIGATLVEIKAGDENGNDGYCSFLVEVIGDDPELVLPNDTLLFVDPGQCGAVVNYTEIEIISNCYNPVQLVLLEGVYESGQLFPIGLTTVYKYIWHEEFQDTLVVDSFRVRVIDNVAPEITCPNDTVVNADKGKSFAIVDYEAPIIFDCTRVDTLFPADSLIPGSEFPIGTTTIEWGARDAGTYKNTCSFNIIVQDAEAPKLTCGLTPYVPVAPGDCDTFLYFRPPQVEDNDSVVSLAHSLVSGNAEGRFHIGDSSFVWTAIDEAGNPGYCTQYVKVIPAYQANLDAISMFKNDTVQFNPYDNDLYCDKYVTILPVNIIEGPWHGDANIIDGFSFLEYIPNSGYTGKDSIQYSLCDTEGVCDTAWIVFDIQIEVIPLMVVPDTLYSLNGGEATGNIIANDQFSKDCAFTLATVHNTGPYYDKNFTIDTATGDVIYTPEEGFYGIDSFKYELCDFWDSCQTGLVLIYSLEDTDHDNLANLIDVDSDNDGIPDDDEGEEDTDGDGIPDYLDIDSDNDGIVDNVEAQPEDENYRAPSYLDNNANGLDDAYDPEEGGTPIILSNVDGDAFPDFQDEDTDNDNAPDRIEGNDANADGMADVVALNSDNDLDGLDDAFDTIDGFASEGNMIGSLIDPQDTDEDNIRDWRDTDDDGDGLTTLAEDLNGDNNPANDDVDLDNIPDYLDDRVFCEAVIPNGFSPNGDGIADYFYIRCINLYPDAKLIIYNRWGQKIYEKEQYGNVQVWGDNDAYWDGTSNTGLQVASGRLPSGTYMYILDFGDGTEAKTGTIFINRKSDSMRF